MWRTRCGSKSGAYEVTGAGPPTTVPNSGFYQGSRASRSFSSSRPTSSAWRLFLTGFSRAGYGGLNARYCSTSGYSARTPSLRLSPLSRYSESSRRSSY